MVRFVLVTLVHNKQDFLKQCIRSALAQTYKNFLYIIVNDGSTDNSDKIIQNFKKKNGNVIYYSFPKAQGQMPRYNFVLQKINKLYPDIQFMGHLDADDMLASTAVEEMFQYFKRRPENIGHISSYFSIIDAKNNIIHKVGRSFPKLQTQAQWRAAQLTNNLFGHFRVMRIKCLNKIGGFDEQFEFATDYNMACKMLDRYNVDVFPKVLYLWRKHGKQVEKQHGAKQTQNWKQIQKYYKKKWGM
jgi:glycosyltransferase involved in cell wall biosynthesis